MTKEFEVKIGRVSLEGFTTAELVAELATRDNCMIVDLPDEYWKLQGVISYSKHGSRANIIEVGPATILVVRE
jgi:hypothetical protein